MLSSKFEKKGEPVLPAHQFVGRIMGSLALASIVLVLTLGIGIAGYHYIARLGWIDALMNASMILTGMGPVAPMTTTAAKLFASVYALFSGVLFLTAMGFVMAPLYHRILHRFHVDDDEK